MHHEHNHSFHSEVKSNIMKSFLLKLKKQIHVIKMITVYSILLGFFVFTELRNRSLASFLELVIKSEILHGDLKLTISLMHVVTNEQYDNKVN